MENNTELKSKLAILTWSCNNQVLNIYIYSKLSKVNVKYFEIIYV